MSKFQIGAEVKVTKGSRYSELGVIKRIHAETVNSEALYDIYFESSPYLDVVPESSIIKYDGSELLLEMASINGGFMSIKLAVWGREGNHPHFHFYKNTPPNDGIPDKGHEGGCICIKQAKYCNHGNHEELMEEDEIKGLIEFLNSTIKELNVTVWKYIINLWNSNNPHMPQVKLDQPIPAYKHDMKNAMKKVSYEKLLLDITPSANTGKIPHNSLLH